MGNAFIFHFRSIFLLLPTVALYGCERYAVTLNQQPVYTPPPLYSDFKVADKALTDCINQTIADQRIVRVEQLKALTCRHAGVASLEGLEHFGFIQDLDVSNNQLVDAPTLARLPQLKTLKIQENPTLNCEAIANLPQRDLRITAPAHCAI